MTLLRPMIDRAIETHGHFLCGVADEPPFIYTVGLHKKGLPEWIILALVSEDIALMLNALIKVQEARGQPFEDRERFEFPGAKASLRFHQAPERFKSIYTIQVGKYYGHENYSLLWVELQDPKNRWSDHPECDFPFDFQHVMARL